MYYSVWRVFCAQGFEVLAPINEWREKTIKAKTRQDKTTKDKTTKDKTTKDNISKRKQNKALCQEFA
jgi:hypothetical protein